MSGIVPKPHHWLRQTVFIAKCTYARSLQHEKSPNAGLQAEPGSGEDSQKVAARENEDVTFESAHPADRAIGPRADLLRRFSVGTAVTKQFPVRIAYMYFRRSKSFVITVVPFNQIRICFGLCTEPGQFARARRTPQRARETFRETVLRESLTEALSVSFAALGKGQVSQPSMLTCETPGGLAVACKV